MKSKNDEIGLIKPEKIISNTTAAKSKEKTSLTKTSIKVKASNPRAYIPISTQRAVYSRDQSCQYHDKVTGHKCTSTWNLTLDDIQPIWAKGENTLENLRLLCAQHNREVYRQQSGIRNI